MQHSSSFLILRSWSYVEELLGKLRRLEIQTRNVVMLLSTLSVKITGKVILKGFFLAKKISERGEISIQRLRKLKQNKPD